MLPNSHDRRHSPMSSVRMASHAPEDCTKFEVRYDLHVERLMRAVHITRSCHAVCCLASAATCEDLKQVWFSAQSSTVDGSPLCIWPDLHLARTAPTPKGLSFQPSSCFSEAENSRVPDRNVCLSTWINNESQILGFGKSISCFGPDSGCCDSFVIPASCK